MKRALISTTLVVAAFFACPGEAAVDNLTDVVPAGSPVVYYVADVPQTIEQWQGSPLAGLWNDPQVKAFFAPLREEIQIGRWNELVRDETGHTLDEIMNMFTGDLVVFVDNFEVVLTEDEPDFDLSVAILATVGDNAAAFEKMILEQEAKLDEKTEDATEENRIDVTHATREFRGVDLHVETTYEGDEVTMEAGWAVVDGAWVFAYPVDSLERIVGDILDGGADEALDSGDNFATVAGHTRGADAWFFMDMEPWVPVLHDVIEMGAAAAQEAGNPFPLDANAIVSALGADAMQALFLAVEQADDIATTTFGLTYTENRGLIKLLAYGPKEAPRPTFIPVDSDAFSTATFDFAGAWAALVDILNGINPALMGMAAMQLESTAQNAGVELDLKRDLLDNLTGELVTVQKMHGVSGETLIELELEQDQIIALGIRQREALENALEGLKTIASQGSELFATRDFEGHTVFTLDVPQAEGEGAGDQVAYVVTDDRLLFSIGSPATLEQTLLAMDGKGGSVWKQPAVRKAVALLPDGSSVVQYQDLAKFGAVIFPIIAAVDGLHLGNEGESEFRCCDRGAMPDADVVGKYFSSAVTGAWKDDRSLVFRSWSLPAERE